MEHKKIVIVGGGIAGISCALKLRESGENFVLITERLGGRIYYSDAEKVNFGAYFVMGNYRHVNKIVRKAARLSKISGQYHNGEDDYYTLFRPKILLQLPQLLRFLRAMLVFSRHFERYKRNCETMPVRQALDMDPYMRELFFLPAEEFIRREGFTGAHDDYFSKFSYACTAVSASKINALDYCTLSLGLLIPLHRFVFDNAGMAAKLGEALRIDSVTRIVREKDRYVVTARDGGRLVCDYAVVATEGSVTQKLLGLPFVRKSYPLHAFHVRGSLKDRYRGYDMNIFAENSEVIAISVQDDGTYLVFAAKADRGPLDACFRDCKVIGSVSWQKALYTEGREIVDEQVAGFGHRLILAGEHNCVGMEPSAITGIFAANSIIADCRAQKSARG